MNKKLLLIAYDFPPILSPESIQVQRKMVALADAGMEIFVITAHANAYFELYDNNLLVKHPNIHIMRTKKPLLEWGINVLCKLLNITDRKLWWYFFARKKALKLIQDEGIAMLYTNSNPLVSHLVGLGVKRRYPGIRWIAHFSDPWTLNPYIRYPLRLQYRLNRYLEKHVIKNADKVTVTSEKTKRLLEKHFKSNIKTYVVPHFFDPEKYRYVKGGESPSIRIVYTGNLYGLRSIKHLLDALQKYKKRGIEFAFYGKVNPKDIQRVYQLGLERIVSFHGQVSYDESLRIIDGADILLVVDAPLENSPFFPSKLVDYIGAKKPIFALTPKNSTTGEILTLIHNDKLIAEGDNEEEISQVLSKIINREFGAKTYENIERFNMHHAATILETILFS